MIKPIYLVLGAIPIIAALLLVTPLLLKNEIPTTAANYTDNIEIEYTKHQLKKITFGITDREGSQKTEILQIKNNGDIKYTVTKEGYPQPEIKSELSEEKIRKLTALIKETGFIEIPLESFPVKENVMNYQKSKYHQRVVEMILLN